MSEPLKSCRRVVEIARIAWGWGTIREIFWKQRRRLYENTSDNGARNHPDSGGDFDEYNFCATSTGFTSGSGWRTQQWMAK